MLKNALVAQCEDLSRGPSIPRFDTRADSEILVEFRWEGHWEVWEREWGGARWIPTLRPRSAQSLAMGRFGSAKLTSVIQYRLARPVMSISEWFVGPARARPSEIEPPRTASLPLLHSSLVLRKYGTELSIRLPSPTSSSTPRRPPLGRLSYGIEGPAYATDAAIPAIPRACGSLRPRERTDKVVPRRPVIRRCCRRAYRSSEIQTFARAGSQNAEPDR